jgi:hypothetical protein
MRKKVNNLNMVTVKIEQNTRCGEKRKRDWSEVTIGKRVREKGKERHAKERQGKERQRAII